jgi:glycosyltransferase involved in cell wall biosynthesis
VESVSETFELAKAAYQSGKWREAIRLCESGLAIEPKHAPTWSLLGEALGHRRRYRESLEAAARALAYGPDLPEHRERFDAAVSRLVARRDKRFRRGQAMLEQIREMEPSGFGHSSGPIHFVCPFAAMAGSEQHALQIYELLRPDEDVLLWAQGKPHAEISDRYPIRRIDRRNYPRGGTLVILGVWWRCRDWILRADPDRMVLQLNTLSPVDLLKWLAFLWHWRDRPIKIIHPSRALQRVYALPGPVEVSPLRLDRFTPLKSRPPRDFTIGRLSRGAPGKHHPADPLVYRAVASMGGRVRVMGAPRLAHEFVDTGRIQIVPSFGEDAVAFLQSLDCFFYRTGEFFESWGRVVSEAMACGLPTVCHNAGGYAEIIEHGTNGFLFDGNEEAIDILAELKRDPMLANRIGEAARASMEALYTPETLARTARLYAD